MAYVGSGTDIGTLAEDYIQGPGSTGLFQKATALLEGISNRFVYGTSNRFEASVERLASNVPLDDLVKAKNGEEEVSPPQNVLTLRGSNERRHAEAFNWALKSYNNNHSLNYFFVSTGNWPKDLENLRQVIDSEPNLKEYVSKWLSDAEKMGAFGNYYDHKVVAEHNAIRGFVSRTDRDPSLRNVSYEEAAEIFDYVFLRDGRRVRDVFGSEFRAWFEAYFERKTGWPFKEIVLSKPNPS